MTKKVLIALTFLVTTLFASNSFATACSSGYNYQFVGVGSSAQLNTFAYAAYFGLSATNFWSTKNAVFQDTRFNPAPIDTSLTMFVAYDNNAYCNVYIYVAPDSSVGVKDFFAYASASVGGDTRLYGAVYGQSGSWVSAAGGGSAGNQIPGIPDSGPALPGAIQTFLTTSPVPATSTSLPQPYCGQIGVVTTTTHFCFFNAGMADIRPEDALYATTRALSSYSTTNGLAGLGYNQTGCGSNPTSSNQGCPINDSFANGKIFNVLNFKLSGADPVTSATVPTYTTLATGLAPVVVLADDADTAGGLGQGAGTAYVINNIQRTTLSNVFNGTSFCTNDLTTTTSGSSGDALNIVIREPLSGTYNTFEFTGVRTLLNSAAATIKQSSVSTHQWFSSDSGGQEFDPNNHLSPAGPLTNYSDTVNCQNNSGKPYVTGAVACGDPLYNALGTCAGSTAAYKIRELGTKHEVLGVMGQDNGNASGAVIQIANGIGYAFWGYGNVEYAVASSSCPDASGDVSCSTIYGHYLTVDGIDPLFASSSGRLDALGNAVPGIAYTLPQCGAIVNNDGAKLPCQPIPFTHVADGSYPLWTLLRAVTFNNVTNKQIVPAGVINMEAAAQTEAANSSHYLSDFLPLLTSVTGSYTQGIGGVTNTADSRTVTWVSGNQFNTSWTGQIYIDGTYYTISSVTSPTSLTLTGSITAAHATAVPYSWNNGTYPSGNLGIGVFRSHYVQSGVNPSNGHAACGGSFTGIGITGAAGDCLVDAGGDVGGAIQTVQSDVDFNNDFGGNVVGSVTYPQELYNLHQ
jgi:hypothetical protein